MPLKTIMDISLQYCFDSQQSFTRSFKKQFDVTPGRYRRREEWDTAGICPPLRIDDYEFPQHKMLMLNNIKLRGLTASYHCNLGNISECREKIWNDFWYLLLEGAKNIPPVIYGLHQVRQCTNKREEQEVLYSAAVSEDFISPGTRGYKEIIHEGGVYACFTYHGKMQDIQEFIMLLYSTCIPALGLVRRQGHDIECFYTYKGNWIETFSGEIHCDYFIPVSLKERRNADN